MDNRQYVMMILKLIFLTCLPAVILSIVNFKSGIGWILGAFGSAVNFTLMALNTLGFNSEVGKVNVVKTVKSFAFRFLFLIVWSLLVLFLIKPELLSYCLGLLAAQIMIFFYQIYYSLRYGRFEKYFRGEDE